MYLHQAIADLQTLSQTDHGLDENEWDAVYRKEIGDVSDKLGTAQCFHFGNVSSIKRPFQQIAGRPLFDFGHTSVRLPYRTCWFEFCPDEGAPLKEGQGECPKRGVLVDEIDRDRMVAWVLDGFRAEGWMLSPIKYLISTSRPTQPKEIKEFDLFVSKKIQTRWLRAWRISRLRYMCGGQFEGRWLPIPLYKTASVAARENLHELTWLHMALLLLNCKNIYTERLEPPERLNKKRTKSGKLPLFSYHVLNVKLPSQRGPEQKRGTCQQHNRVHFCRGHFKEFTAQAPLFGKHIGFYWWQPHLRGRNMEWRNSKGL